MCTKIVPSFFLLVINFCFISSNRRRDLRIPKNVENAWLQRNLLNDFHQKLIDTNLCWGDTKYKVLWNSVHQFSSYTYHKIFVAHTQTHKQTHRQRDRHFPEIVKSCSGHLKLCKSIENRKSKIFANPILSSYVYRRK